MPFARRMLVEERRWLTEHEFVEVLSLSQFLPGPNIINVSIIVGSRFAGPAGSFAASLGLMLMPFPDRARAGRALRALRRASSRAQRDGVRVVGRNGADRRHGPEDGAAAWPNRAGRSRSQRSDSWWWRCSACPCCGRCSHSLRSRSPLPGGHADDPAGTGRTRTAVQRALVHGHRRRQWIDPGDPSSRRRYGALADGCPVLAGIRDLAGFARTEHADRQRHRLEGVRIPRRARRHPRALPAFIGPDLRHFPCLEPLPRRAAARARSSAVSRR